MKQKLKQEESGLNIQRGIIVKMNVVDIINRIKKLVEEKDLVEGNTAKVTGFSREEAILFEAVFAGDRRYSVKKEVSMNAEHPEEIYTFHVRYVGKGFNWFREARKNA